jgi:hypothetical protein
MIANPLEDNMTNSAQRFSATAIAISAGLFALSFFGASAQASVTSDLQRCQANSSTKVLSCCNTATRDTKPLWMKEAGASCASLVVCSRHNRNSRCYVQILVGDGQGSSGRHPVGRTIKVLDIRSSLNSSSQLR